VKREIEEKSIPVIAQELGVPEESVKHLLHRARRALRRHLAKTHLAPGANLEDVSTLALLARSAAAGGGRAGVAVLFLVVCLVGVKPNLPATALTSWPLHDLIPAVGRVLSPVPVQAPAPKPKHVTHNPARVQVAVPQAPDPVAPQGTAKLTVVAPRPSAGATALTVKPEATPAAKPSPESSPASASPSPSASGSPSPSGSPDPSASPSTSASPDPSPRPSSTGEPRPPHLEASPSASPGALPAG
jgi:hypothetical protein